MKQIIINRLSKLVVLVLVLSGISNSMLAQSVNISTANCTVATNEIQFDVLMQNNSVVPLQFNSNVIRLTHSAAILAGTGTNTIVFSYVGGSAFPLSWPPNSNPTFTYNSSTRLFGISTGTGIYLNGGACAAPNIPVGATVTLGRFSLKNTAQDFVAGASVDLVWSTTTAFIGYINCAPTTTGFNTAGGNRTLSAPCSLVIPSGPVPLGLLNFSGKNNGTYNSLQWSTTSEQNSDRFELERSIDGVNFTTVQVVDAAGNSTTLRNYNKQDQIAGLNARIFYYRLKIVDLSGVFTYSNIVKLKVGNKLFNVETAPNPFVDQIRVQIDVTQSEQATLTLTDLQGRKILQQNQRLNDGSNVINLNKVAELPSGVYLLRIVSGSEQETIKVVKQ